MVPSQIHFHCTTMGTVCLIKIIFIRSSLRGSAVTNPTNTHEDKGSIPGLAQGLKGEEMMKIILHGRSLEERSTRKFFWETLIEHLPT